MKNNTNPNKTIKYVLLTIISFAMLILSLIGTITISFGLYVLPYRVESKEYSAPLVAQQEMFSNENQIKFKFLYDKNLAEPKIISQDSSSIGSDISGSKNTTYQS